jgi:hypothetical protein
MILLAVRIELEMIFRSCYPGFMSVKLNEKMIVRYYNGLLTELLDPNIYYSRFSFLESGKEAIDLKSKIAKNGG